MQRYSGEEKAVEDHEAEYDVYIPSCKHHIEKKAKDATYLPAWVNICTCIK